MPTVLSFVPFCGDEGDLVYMYEMTECLEADLYNLFILTPSSHKVSGTQMIKFGCFHAINVFFFFNFLLYFSWNISFQMSFPFLTG